MIIAMVTLCSVSAVKVNYQAWNIVYSKLLSLDLLLYMLDCICVYYSLVEYGTMLLMKVNIKSRST